MKTPITSGIRHSIAALLACAGANFALAQLNCPELRESAREVVPAESAVQPVAPATANALMFDARASGDVADCGSKLLAAQFTLATGEPVSLTADTKRKVAAGRSRPELVTNLLLWSAGAPAQAALCSSSTEPAPVRIAALRPANSARVRAQDLESVFPATLRSLVLEKFASTEGER